ALLAAAHGSVEVGQLGFVHGAKRTTTPMIATDSGHGLSARRIQLSAQFEALAPKYLVPGTRCVALGAKNEVRRRIHRPAYDSSSMARTAAHSTIARTALRNG